LHNIEHKIRYIGLTNMTVQLIAVYNDCVVKKQKCADSKPAHYAVI